jgi:MOSC domain-containing protein YiiM
MVNLDPDSARSTPEVLKSIARANHSNAGIYATVIRTGRLAAGQPIRLHKPAHSH